MWIIIFCVCIIALLLFNNSSVTKNKFTIDFDKIINNNPDIFLTIYHTDSFLYETRTCVQSEHLISGYENGRENFAKITINSAEIKQNSNVFSTFGKRSYIVSDDTSDYVNARIYYVFESEDKGKILEVTLGINGVVLVNGKYIKHGKDNDTSVFYELILPFLKDDRVKKEVEEFIY